MIGVALALLVLGVLMLFVVPAIGIPVGIVGAILLIVYLVGAARRPATRP